MRNFKKSLVAVISILAVFLWSLVPTGVFFMPQIAKAAALTSVTVAPLSNNVDNLIGQSSATWQFTINNATALTANTDAVVITFPTIGQGSWDLSGGTATSTAAGGDAVTFATSPLVVGGPDNRVVTIMALTSQTSANNDFTIKISGITNPAAELSQFASPLSWSAKTCTLTTAGNPANGCGADLDTTASGAALLKRRGGAVTSATLTASSTAASVTTQYRLQFTASTTLAVGEKIWINFPVGFTLTNATTSAQADINGSSANAPQIAEGAVAMTTDNGLNAGILTISNEAVAAGDTVTVTIGRVQNPVKGAYQVFRFFTTTANNGLVDGVYYGMDTGANQFGPPPVDSIQIGGNNTVTGTVKVRRAGGALETVTADEAAQLQVGMGSPSEGFYVGTKSVAADGTFTYSNLLSATYILFVMPFSETSSFFESYISPNMIQVNVTGSETVTVQPTFEVPDSFIAGTITGGVADAAGIYIRAYTAQLQTFSEVFTSTAYTTAGLNGSGVGYFKIPVKSNNTWNINVMSENTLVSGNTEYWTPIINPVYVPDTNTVTTTAVAFVAANKRIEVTLTNSIDNSTITTNVCLNLRRTGEEMMGPGGAGVCSATARNTYVLKAPAGPFAVQVMAPGMGFKEYPVTVASDTTTTTKAIIFESPSTYISGTVRDADNVALQGVSVMANGSDGSFNQAMTNSSGQYTIYSRPGVYAVEAFAPGYGPIGRLTNVTVSQGSNATNQNFTISSGNFKTIQGRVYNDANISGDYDEGETTYQYVHIFAFSSTGGNGTQTRGDGTYTLKVPAGTYTVGGWHEDLGGLNHLTNVDVSLANVTDQDFTVAVPGYLQIRITDGNVASLSPVFAGAFNSSGKGNGSNSFSATGTSPSFTDIDNLVTKFSLPAGTYDVRVGTPAYGELTSLAANSGARSATITAGQVTNLTIALPTLYTVSGTATAGATVWAAKTDSPGKYNAVADSSGNYSMKIPAGTYMIGASLPGYINTPSQQTISTSIPFNLTLTASAATITGTVTNASTNSELTEGFVWATKASNQGWVGAELNADGTYSLEVDDGTWTVYADGPCYYQSLGTSQTGSGTVNISLTSRSGCTFFEPETQSMVPSSGGSISQSDIKVTIPANALGTGSSAVTVNVGKPNTVPPSTLNAAPLSDAAQSITASDSSGTTISTLNSSIEVVISYNDSDIPNGSSENDLQLAYWNTTNNSWEPVAATLDTTNNTLTARVSHLTDFAPVVPTGEDVPDTPTGFAATRDSFSPYDQINLSWIAVDGATGYVLYRDTNPAGSFANLATIASGSTISYSNTGLSSSVTYYYKITSSNSNGESAASGAVSASTAVLPSGGGTSGGAQSSPIITQPAQHTTTTGSETISAPQVAPTAEAPSTTNGQVTVSPTSGAQTQLTTAAGTMAQVIIPPQAVGAETALIVNQVAVTTTTGGGDTATTGSGSSAVPAVPTGSAIVGGLTYAVSAQAGEATITSFSDSLTLTLTYTNEQLAGLDESSLKVYYYNTTNNFWVSLTSTIDVANNKITAYFNHLTTFAVIGTKTFDAASYEGKVIKAANSTAVYLVNQGYRRAFTSEMMYFSYGYKWSDLTITNNVNNISRGSDMVYSDTHTFTAGQMIKGTNEKVYFIDDLGYRHWVETAEVYLGLGYEWKQVAWISDMALAKYAEGSSIKSADVRPNGSLVKYSDSDKVYLIENGQKRWIVDEVTFNAKNYGWYNIIIIPKTESFVSAGNLTAAAQ